MKEIKIYNTLLCSVMSESNEYNEDVNMYAEELAEALRKEDTDLAPYADDYHGETFYKKLRSTKITTEWHDNTLYGLCTATVEDNWTDSDTAELKEYLSSQRKLRRSTTRKPMSITKANGRYATMFTFPFGRAKDSGL